MEPSVMSIHSSPHSSTYPQQQRYTTTISQTTPAIIKTEQSDNMMAYHQQYPEPYGWYDPQLSHYHTHQQIIDTTYTNNSMSYQSPQVACASPSMLSHSPSVNDYPSPRHTPSIQVQTTNLAVPYAPSSPATPMSFYEPLTPQSPPQDAYYTPIQGSKVQENVCNFPGCNTKGKFARKTDLNRHYKTQHDALNNMQDCKHGWCGRTGTNGFSRADHLREHLREVHRENIPFKTTRKNSSNKSPKQKGIKTEDGDVKVTKRRA